MKKKPGPKKKPFLPFEEVKKIVREENVTTVNAYQCWWDLNRPKVIPKYPYRVYKEWTTWNEFLGTNNKFEPIRPTIRVRPYSEAVLWVHKLKLKNQSAWHAWVQEHKDKGMPSDIPRRPDTTYKKHWVSWNQWLGCNAKDKVEAQQKAQLDASIFYVIHEKEHPPNVVVVGIETGGKSALEERWKQKPFDVIKLFKYRHDAGPVIQQIVNQNSKPIFGSDQTRVVPNVHQFIWDISTILDVA